jgi:hypothetical protein
MEQGKIKIIGTKRLKNKMQIKTMNDLRNKNIEY